MENQIAKFRFAGFSIKKSTIEILDCSNIASEISLNIDFRGKHRVKECRYDLSMKIELADKNKSIQSTVEAIGYYEFDNDCQDKDLSNYFYVNAPAILFPYVRAYTATLSTLSGLRNPVMIPTLNLTKFAAMIKENTEKI